MQNPFKISNFAGKFQSFSRGKWKIKELKNYRIKERGEIMKISLLKLSRAKYELICSHTARRSGTTNLYKLGVLSDLELRSITGHESQKNFEGYIRIGISEQAQRVGDKIKAAMEAKKQVDK